MLPFRWSLSQKGIEPFYSVIRLHQTVKIELLDTGDLGFHARRKVAARRLDGVTQRAGALRLKVFVEIPERGGLRVRCRGEGEAHGNGFGAGYAAAGQEQVDRPLRADHFR